MGQASCKAPQKPLEWKLAGCAAADATIKQPIFMYGTPYHTKQCLHYQTSTPNGTSPSLRVSLNLALSVVCLHFGV